MIKPELNGMFNFPVCYHPTTVLSIDDDLTFLEILSARLADRLALLCFDKPQVALEYTKYKHHYLPFRDRCLISNGYGDVSLDIKAIRNELYNKDRFKEIFINVTDYDMPLIDGIEITKTMEFEAKIPRYSHIFLTGKATNDFKKMVKNKDFIGKDDPEYINNLLNLIDERSFILFSNYSHEAAILLSRDKTEKTSVLFDGNFSPIFNSFLKENNICEFYLYDKQGSFLMLDADANFSWLFIRNDMGMDNSIALAKQYNAPSAVIDALKSKNYLLSLYEEEDIKSLLSINWDKFLLPAQSFQSNSKYLNFFSHTVPATTPVYYYAYTKEFQGHTIQTKDILSYNEFLMEHGT